MHSSDKTLVIVPCGKKKIWDENPNAGSAKARDVYIGSFAKKCTEYAEKFYPSCWCILSAKYGFLFPDDTVSGSYNVSFNDKKTNPITLKRLSKQVTEKGLNDYDKIIILGGKNYVKIIKKIFIDKKIHLPLENCKGIGYMMKKLNDAINKGVSL